MSTTVWRFFGKNQVFWLFTVPVLLLVLMPHVWPASWWLEVRSVSAGTARAGEAIPMIVERTIHRPFVGTWVVSVRRWNGSGWVSHCSATGTTQYRSGAELPSALTLSWWTAGACPTLPEGRYVVGTVWWIDPFVSFLPRKNVQIESNIFEVTP
jgi:hypothetical protein